MKVRHCDYTGVLVEMSATEFKTMTGVQVGDHYGNHGIAHGKLQGQEFPFPQKKFDDLYAFYRALGHSQEKIDYIKDLLMTMAKPQEDKSVPAKV